MTNTFINTTLITNEALKRLKGNLVAAKYVDLHWSSEFGNIGSSISIRQPVMLTSTTGATLSTQNITEKSSTITFGNTSRKQVAYNLTTQELTLNNGNRVDTYIEAAMVQLASKIDADILSVATSAYNSVGVAGTTPTSTTVLRDIMAAMDSQDVPRNSRVLFLNPFCYANLMEAMKSSFTPDLNNSAIRMGGVPGDIYGFDGGIIMSQNVATHVSGTEASGTLAVNDTIASGDTAISINTGTTSGTLVPGDILTFAKTHAVDPNTKTSTGVLKRFVVTATSTASSGAYTKVAVSPAFISTGAYQNIDVLPASSDAVVKIPAASGTVVTHNIGFQKGAIALVTRPLAPVMGGALSETKIDPDTGLSVRLVIDYDYTNDLNVVRFDVLEQPSLINPEFSTLILG